MRNRLLSATVALLLLPCAAVLAAGMDAASATLYEMRFHDETKRSEAWLDRQSKKFEGGFKALEAMLGGRRWCVGDKMTLADISVACHLGFINLRVPQYFPADKYPGLARLWRSMEERDSFKRTAPPRT
jgi:glutathione S-transferase